MDGADRHLTRSAPSVADTESAGLNTTLEPRAVDFAGHRITLRGLTPHPVYDEPFDADEYVAELAVVDTR